MEKFSKRAMLLRKGMIVIQFSVSIILLKSVPSRCTNSWKYTGNKSLG